MKKIIHLFITLVISTVFSAHALAYDITVSGQLTENYWSLESIYTSGTCEVEAGSDVTLEAQNSIVLSPGFHAKPGSTFTAKIGTVPDSDGDGMPDAWETQHELSDSFGDEDGDGYCNLREYLGNSDPNTPDAPQVSITINVDDVATNGNGSAATPFNTIQDAIDFSADGDRVLVADGTYTGEGNRDIDFNGKAISLRSENGAESTIIDIQGSATDLHRGFHFYHGEGNDAIVDGFTIINGYVLYPNGNGGGIFCESGSPLIKNCIINNNYSQNSGGGICCFSGEPVITDCTIKDNTADLFGGGIYTSGNISIINCTISGNEAPGSWGGTGGGISIWQSNPLIANCIITGNSAYVLGGGIDCELNSNPEIINCTITRNTCQNASGAGSISCYNNSNATITNCILWDNTPNEIYTYSSAPNVTYSNIKAGTGQSWFGAGCLDIDPLFLNVPNLWDKTTNDGTTTTITVADASIYSSSDIIEIDNDGTARTVTDASDTTVTFSPALSVNSTTGMWVQNWGAGATDLNEDSHLDRISPCIDVGSNAALPADITDMDNDGDTAESIPYDFDAEDRILDGTNTGTPTVDMGVYEILSIVFVDSANNTGVEDGSKANPFNTIQEGIDAAVEGQIVQAADGTYNESEINFQGKIITVRSENGPGYTTIDCLGTGSGFHFQSSEGSGSVLDGFTITGAVNGGIFCESGSSPEIKNCIITYNSGNVGGIHCSDSSPFITNCLITHNTSSTDGGGILCAGNSSPTVTNCTIVENTATGIGGGIKSDVSAAVVTNCIIWDNSPDQISGSPTVTYSDVQGGVISGTGNISDNPLFTYQQEGDYHLSQINAGQTENSPCLNTGDPNTPLFDGTTRTDGEEDSGTVDMGYHYGSAMHNLTIAKIGDGNGTISGLRIDCGSNCSEDYSMNTVVTLSASSDSISDFIEWSGDCSGIGDCIIKMSESRSVTAMFLLDSDRDGIYDYIENSGCMDAFNEDTDNDGISDAIEDSNRNGTQDTGETNPCSPDSDNDGMLDGWEDFYGLNPLDPNDADADSDSDNLTNLMEYRIGSDPTDNSNPASGVYYDYDKLGRIKRIIRKQ